jgi:hypothetical protein
VVTGNDPTPRWQLDAHQIPLRHYGLLEGLSYNGGKNWSVNGSIYVGNQTSFLSGFNRGPNFSYQWKMPVSYASTPFTCAR